MARKQKKSRKKPARRSKTEWLGATTPVGIDCELIAWVDRQSGELLDTELCRRPLAQAQLERTAQRLIKQRGKPSGRICVPERATAQRLREAMEGVPVGAGFDVEADEVWGRAASSAPCLEQETAVTLSGGEPTYTLELTLRGIEPPIWRRVRIAGDASLDVLHAVLQEAMGWEDCHLHQFDVHGEQYGMVDGDALSQEHDEEEFQIGMLLKKGGQATYVYDFGDSWTHDILVEDVSTASQGDPVATCLAGARACPPEDAGGPWGYEDKLAARAEPQSEHDHWAAEWLGEDFDPESFDCERADTRVRSLFVVGGQWDDDEAEDDDWIDDEWLDADVDCLYDADRGPDPKQWLDLDEDEQHYHVRLHHKRSEASVPPAGDFSVHAVLHSVVETQIAANEPAMTSKTLVRLLGEGLGRHEAIHAIASVLAEQTYELVRIEGEEAPSGFDELAYARELKKLNARDWFSR